MKNKMKGKTIQPTVAGEDLQSSLFDF